MARIRTIKPEFFTSEDIVGLSPMARLLYIATWCEADKEGRLTWKPMTFKLRYFPGDSCEIQAMCKELVDAKLVVPYDDGLAYIPKFSTHQHINPRESASILPEPKTARVSTRRDASARVNSEIDAQGGREGKGKEGKDIGASDESQPKTASRKSRLPDDFVPSFSGVNAAKEAGLDVQAELRKFADHHVAKGSVMSDWQAAWRTWIGKAVEFGRGGPSKSQAGDTSWLEGTGFENVAEAMNARCHIGNAHEFRDGHRMEHA